MSITQRIDNITFIPENYRSPTPPCPKSVKIELTGRCNFNCSFCARSQRLRKTEDMNKDFYKRIVKEMREAGIEELGLFYLGESFLCDWLEEAIHYAKHEVGIPYVFLTTNGSLSTPERVESCIRAGLDSLKFSFNYADLEQFKQVARVKPKLWLKTRNNVVDARLVRDKVKAETGQHCGLYASYIRYDGEQGKRILEEISWVEKAMDEVYALPLYTQAALVSDSNRKNGWNATAGNRGRADNLRDPLPCWAVFTEGHISWDGGLSACCFDHNKDYTMADLTQTPFMQAWHSDKFQQLRQAHLRHDVSGTPCENCVVG